VVLVALNALFTPGFASAGNLWNVLLQVAEVLLVAVGMTLVIATGGVDLSVGSVMALAGAVAAVTLDRGVGPAVAMALAAALGVGLVNGFLVARARVQPIVVTAGHADRRARARADREQRRPARDDRRPGVPRPRPRPRGAGPGQVLFALAVAAAAAFALRETAFGRYVLAAAATRRRRGWPACRSRARW
jgi:ribose/xylose/arabinose/galactoside ABC-type transport system permease subunit